MSDLTVFGAYCRKQATSKSPTREGDRLLWTMLADEVDAYVAGDPDVIQTPTPDGVPLEGM